MNLLFLPLTIGAITYFVCALIEVFTDKRAIRWLNSMLANKWVIAFAVILMLTSWGYNIWRGI